MDDRRHPPAFHTLRRPEFLVGAAFGLAMLLVAWGAWALRSSMLRHRETADETLRDHAAYLAASYAGSVQSRTYIDIRTLLRGAQRALASAGRLSADSVIQLTGQESLTPYLIDLAPRRYFVFDSSTARATSAGDTTTVELATSLRARLAVSRPSETTYLGAVVVHGPDTTIAFVEREVGGTRWVGIEVDLKRYRRHILLPPLEPTLTAFNRLRDSLAMPPGDSLASPIALELRGIGGEVLAQVGDISAGPWRSDRPLMGPLLATVTYAILAPAVPVLMPGGYPPMPGARVTIFVALATLLLGGATIIAWRAIALSRLREEFTSNMSHELRTPLANIQLFAETLLLERAVSETERHRALDTIVRETRHLGQMVENVLALSRVGRPAHRLSPRPEQVDRLIREVTALFEPLARQHRIAIDVTVVPSPQVELDPDAVRRILINLLDNAIRHGGDDGTVTVTAAATPTLLELAVADEGPGIPRADQERIWQPFHRGDGNGSGIGLAVVKQLVLLHGGRVDIDNILPHGVRIRVHLPLAPRSR